LLRRAQVIINASRLTDPTLFVSVRCDRSAAGWWCRL